MSIKAIIKSYIRGGDRLLISSPTIEEIRVIEEARIRMKNLPALDETGELSASDREWLENRKRIRNLVIYSDPRYFLRWDVIRHTMFVTESPFVRKELSSLINSGVPIADLEEDNVGSPESMRKHPQTSANLIHHAFHIHRFEETTGVSITGFDQILEFGGGYGSLCRLILRKGFRGRYIVFDLPEFNILQYIYLTLLGLPVRFADASTAARQQEKEVLLVSSIEELKRALPEERSQALLIGTWSVSETSLDFRKGFFGDAGEFAGYLLAYQDRFNEVDNVAYFKDFAESRGSVWWISEPCFHLSGNQYLFGSTGTD